MVFKDRHDAGKQLAKVLQDSELGKSSIVYAIPRGGVVCALEVAKILKAPLSLIIVRKIGHQYNSEYAIGAVAEDGCSELTIEAQASDQIWLKKEIEKQRNEARRRRETYLGKNQILSPLNKTAIIVDDGLATGLTMLMAIKEVRHLNPKKIIVAIPVGAKETVEKLKKEVDKLIVLYIPEMLYSIGEHYLNFRQVSDEEVVEIMETY
jgi:predicted phosphoribosyltransferase